MNNRIGDACWWKVPYDHPNMVCEWRGGRLRAWSTDHEDCGEHGVAPVPVAVVEDDERGTCHSVYVERVCFAPRDPSSVDVRVRDCVSGFNLSSRSGFINSEFTAQTLCDRYSRPATHTHRSTTNKKNQRMAAAPLPSKAPLIKHMRPISSTPKNTK